MNAAVRSAVRTLLYNGYIPLVVHNGFEGLATGLVSLIDGANCSIRYYDINQR